MDKYQYQCIKAAINEVDSLKADGYQVHMKYSAAGGWWMRFLKHPNGHFALVEMNSLRDEMRVYICGQLKKCQKFGA